MWQQQAQGRQLCWLQGSETEVELAAAAHMPAHRTHSFLRGSLARQGQGRNAVLKALENAVPHSLSDTTADARSVSQHAENERGKRDVQVKKSNT